MVFVVSTWVRNPWTSNLTKKFKNGFDWKIVNFDENGPKFGVRYKNHNRIIKNYD